MEGLISAILFFLIASAIGKNIKKVAKNRPGQAPAPRTQRPGQPDWKQMLPPELRELLGEEEEAPHAEPFPAVESDPSEEGTPSLEGVGQGEGRYDGGYIDGSLPHPKSLNEVYIGGSLPPRESDRLVPPKAARPLAVANIEEPAPAIARADLRRAVVMAEVLARPVALRPRGYRL